MRELPLSAPEGVRVVPVRHSGVGVLTVAGSSGRVDSGRPRLFAAHGALAESIRWFGGPGQPPGPWDVPIEQFQQRVAALRTACDRILVAGTSFGSEAAMLTGIHTEGVDAAAAAIPVERLRRLLLVAGADDRVWPSARHAEALAARRGRDTVVVLEPEAGHRAILPGEPAPTAGIRMARGGSPAADRRLGALAWESLRRLMEELTA